MISHHSPQSYLEALPRLLGVVPVLSAHRVDLDQALGRVLRQEVIAHHDQPPTDLAAVDGYAVHSQEVQPEAVWPVSGSIGGEPRDGLSAGTLPRKSVMKISAGQAMPVGADAVIPLEAVARSPRPPEPGSHAPGRHEDPAPSEIRSPASSMAPGQNVCRRGSDLPRGAVALPANTVLGPHHIGIAAACGATGLLVVDRPRVRVLSVADVKVGRPSARGSDASPPPPRSANGAMLTSFLHRLDIASVTEETVCGDLKPAVTAVGRAAAVFDLLIVLAPEGHDYPSWLAAICPQLGLEKILDRVAVTPGGEVFAAGDRNRLVLGLTGVPLVALATAHLFLWPVVRRMMGRDVGQAADLPWRQVRLAGSIETDPGAEVLRLARSLGDQVAEPVTKEGHDDLSQTGQADGWVRLPRGEGRVQKGGLVPFLSFLL